MTTRTRKARGTVNGRPVRRKHAAQRTRHMSTRRTAFYSVIATLTSVVWLAVACTPDEADAMPDPGPAHQTSYPADDAWPDLPHCMMESTDAAGIPLDDDLGEYPHVDAYEPCKWDADERGNGQGTSFVVDMWGERHVI